MIEVFENELRYNERASSKGNQLKWRSGNLWYKADYAGYEGLAEYIISSLLTYTNLSASEFVLYRTEDIVYKSKHIIRTAAAVWSSLKRRKKIKCQGPNGT